MGFFLPNASNSVSSSGGSGNYPEKVSSSTDNGIVRFDGTSGAQQNSGVTIGDGNELGGFGVSIVDNANTSYTLSVADRGIVTRFTSGSAIGIVLPKTLPKGYIAIIVQAGAGQITFSAESGATINNRYGFTKTNGQHAVVEVFVSSNTDDNSAVYNLHGDAGV